MDASLFELNERLDRSLRSHHVDHNWYAEVLAKLHAYRACLQRHVHAADGERGWIADLREDSPRIEPLARRMRADFARLDDLVIAALTSVRAPQRSRGDVRHAIRSLVDTTRRHRSRCSSLMHEALAVDLGVG
jgi:hypothetical protein